MTTSRIRFSGDDGILDYGDGREVRCSFEIRQHGNADVYLQCQHDREDWMHLEFEDPQAAPLRLRGMTRDGRPIVLDGGLTPVRVRLGSEGHAITYFCGGPHAARLTDEWEGPALARFALTNLLFRGRRVAAPDARRGLSVDIAGRRIALLQVPEYTELEGALKESHGIEVTCHAEVSISGRQDLEEAVEAVDRLTYLLTLATGTVVSWTAYDVVDAAGVSLREVVRSAVTKPYAGPSLIDTRDANVLGVFLESLYAEYLRLDPTYQLARVIHARTDVNGGGFLETRAFATAVLLEYVVGTYLRANMSPQPAKRPSLRRRVMAVCDALRVAATEDEVRAAVTTRNALAHEMRFATSDSRTEYAALAHLLDRILLRLLNYAGPYVDRRTFRIATMD